MAITNLYRLIETLIICENPIISQQIKNSLAKNGYQASLSSFSESSRQSSKIKAELIFIELGENYPEKLAFLSQLKSRSKMLVVVGITPAKFFKNSLDSLKSAVDYLLTTPIKYKLLPALIAKIIY